MAEEMDPTVKQTASGLLRYFERLSRLSPMAIMFLGVLLSVFMLAVPRDADAKPSFPPPTCQQDSLFCIEPNDYSLNWLRTAFPELVSAVTGSNGGVSGTPASGTPAAVTSKTNNLLFTNLMKVLNSIVLAVASLLLSYKILAGVVQTANDGEVLGKRWSTLWGPLRVVTAAGLLVPTASGYSLIQAIIIGIALTGVGFANAGWRSVVESMVNGGALVAPSVSQQSKEVVRLVFANNMCLHAVNITYSEMLQSGDSTVNPYAKPVGDGSPGYPWGWAGSAVAGGAAYKTGSAGALETPAVFRKVGIDDNLGLGWQGSQMVWRMSWTPPKRMTYPGSGLQSNMCGSIKLARNMSGVVDKTEGPWWNVVGFAASGLKTAANVVGFAANPKSIDDAVAFYNYQEGLLRAQGNAIDVMAKALDKPALVMVKSWYPFGDQKDVVMPDMKNQNLDASNDLANDFLNAAVNYETQIATSLSSYRVQSTDAADQKVQFKNYALDRGWASAGEWYLTMAKINQLAQDLNKSNPEVENKMDLSVFFDKLSSMNSEEFKRVLDLENKIKNGMDAAMNAKTDADLYNTGTQGEKAQQIKNYLKQAHAAPNQDALGVAFDEIGKTLGGVFDGLGKTFASFGAGAFGLPLDSNTPNPLITIVDGGRRLFYTGVVIVYAKQLGDALKGVSSALGSVGGPKGKAASEVVNWAISGMQGMAEVIKPVAVAFLLLPGFMMGFVVPILPWVLWVSALLGWFILVVEAVIAAPLWALAHMRMDGEGIAGPMGEQGYRLALSILMRPILMIVGLVAGLVILTIFIPFVGASIWVAEAMNDSAGAAEGFIMRGVIMVIQSFFMVYVCYRCFNLITHVPDRVLRWIGHGGEGLGESEPVDQAKALFVAAVGGPGGMSSLGMSGGGGGGKNNQGGGGGGPGAGAGIQRVGRSNTQNQNQTRTVAPPPPPVPPIP